MPQTAGTALLLAGLLFTWVTLDGDTSSALAHHAAVGVGLSLLATFALDYRHGLRGLLRTDNIAFVGLYGLTLLEFLFDQPAFDTMVPVSWVGSGITACLIGFAGLAVGRHLAPSPPRTLIEMVRRPIKHAPMLRLFWLCVGVGYLNMLLTVGFSIAEMIHYWGQPRFTQPWGRGKFGNWSALLYELNMLLYLIPPLAGVILARAHKYSRHQVLSVVAVLLVTLFYGFAGGTRNIFGAYLITLLVAYLFALPPIRPSDPASKRMKPWLAVVAAMILMAVAVKYMVAFRGMGFWTFLERGMEYESYLESQFFVDYNLWVISTVVHAFPDAHSFLGWEIPYQGVIRPIPRAIWLGKPEGLSLAIEDVVGVQGLTLASSFVGEAYMSAGMLGVLLAGLFFGATAQCWNRLASPDNSDLGVLIYASGFFAIAISMRSLFVFTTAALPTIAALVYCYWVTRNGRAASGRLIPSFQR